MKNTVVGFCTVGLIIACISVFAYMGHKAHEDKSVQPAVTAFIVGNNPRLPPEYAERLGKMMVREAVAVGVDPASLIAVAAVENHFWPDGKSKKGALGVMQVMPFWTKEPEWKHLPERLLNDTETSIKVGAHIIKKYRKECGSIETGFACYVAGPGNKGTQEAKDYAQKVITLRDKLCSVEPELCNIQANSGV